MRIYAGADGSFTLYEDENDNYDYEKGVHTTISLQWDDVKRTLTIGRTRGEIPRNAGNSRVSYRGGERGPRCRGSSRRLKRTSSWNAEALLRYRASNGWLDGQPAVLTGAYGNGSTTYIGAVLDDKLMAAAAQWMVRKSGITPAFGAVPEGIDVSARENAKNKSFVVIIFGQAAQHVALPHPMKALLGGGDNSAVDLPAYGVEVLLSGK